MSIAQPILGILQHVNTTTAWIGDGTATVLTITTRLLANTHAMWAFTGLVMLTVAMGNAWLISMVSLPPNGTLPSLIGSVVFGSLGARFVGNWLTQGAK